MEAAAPDEAWRGGQGLRGLSASRTGAHGEWLGGQEARPRTTSGARRGDPSCRQGTRTGCRTGASAATGGDGETGVGPGVRGCEGAGAGPLLDAGSGRRRGPSEGPILLVSDLQVRACPEHRQMGRGGGGCAQAGEGLMVGGAPAAGSDPAGLFPPADAPATCERRPVPPARQRPLTHASGSVTPGTAETREEQEGQSTVMGGHAGWGAGQAGMLWVLRGTGCWLGVGETPEPEQEEGRGPRGGRPASAGPHTGRQPRGPLRAQNACPGLQPPLRLPTQLGACGPRA